MSSSNNIMLLSSAFPRLLMIVQAVPMVLLVTPLMQTSSTQKFETPGPYHRPSRHRCTAVPSSLVQQGVALGSTPALQEKAESHLPSFTSRHFSSASASLLTWCGTSSPSRVEERGRGGKLGRKEHSALVGTIESYFLRSGPANGKRLLFLSLALVCVSWWSPSIHADLPCSSLDLNICLSVLAFCSKRLVI